VTEREELERELQHVQRLDSIGRLAGGIAHDFNNLLTAILGFADLLLLTLRRNDPRRTDLGEIHRAAQSAAGLTRQLLAFSRKQVLKPVVLDLNKHIAGLTALLRRLLGDAIVVRTRFHPRQLRITADPTQLEQIVLNLAINARDAMPGGGWLTIETSDMTLPVAPPDVEDFKPGDYVALVISDTGHGMADDVRRRAVDPFFTTKPQGKGTGLGLSMTFGYVRQSAGYLVIQSAPDEGTAMTILMPRDDQVPRDDQALRDDRIARNGGREST
jgi:signal transduction histidine kinase